MSAMSIAWTALSFGVADDGEDAGALGIDISGAGLEVAGALVCSDDGGPISVRIESSTGLSELGGLGGED
jgi:hypothetical protein